MYDGFLRSDYDRPLQSDIDYRLWVLIGRVRDTILKLRSVELARQHVSPVEAYALIVLGDIDAESATTAELSRRMNRRHWTATALLHRMAKKGLVRRAKVSPSSRMWHIQLTPDGKAAREQALRLTSIHAAMAGLSDEDKIQFESFLKTVHECTRSQFMDGLVL